MDVSRNDNDDDCKLSDGNPIHVATGSKLERVKDIEFGELELSRYYSSSGVRVPGGFGSQWRHTYDRTILSTIGSVRYAFVYRHDGRQYRFTHMGGQWVTSADVPLQLEETSVGGLTTGWTLRERDGSSEQYDAAGNLLSIRWRDGRQVDVLHAAGRVSRVTDRFGRYLDFSYVGGKVSRVDRSDGHYLLYGYDAVSGMLTSVQHPAPPGAPAAVRSYLYEDPSFSRALTGMTDESGARVATWNYDAQGRAILSEHGDGTLVADRHTLVYGSDGTTVVTDALGQVTTYDFEPHLGVYKLSGIDFPCNSCAGSIGDYTYDANGYPDLETDFRGVTTDRDFNASGLETQRIESKSAPGNPNPAEKRTIQTDWHASFRVPTERRTLNASGALVAQSNWTYNARGQVLTHTVTDPATSATRTTTTSYCEQADVDAPGSTCPLLGLVKSVDGPRTDVSDLTTYTYYAATDESGCAGSGPCHRKGDLWKVTTALGHITETLRYDRAGRVRAAKDANGVITEFTYHPRGWLLTRTVKGATAPEDAVTTFTYDATGQVTRVTQPDGDFLDYEYDAAHRLVAVEDALGHRIEYTLDAAGNRTAEQTKDPLGSVTRSLSRVYNQLGRLTQQLDALSRATVFDHDANGNLTETTDALSTVTEQSYDPLDRLASTLQDVGGLEVETEYGYDALDRLVRVTDPKGLDTDYAYDGLGNLTQLDSPDTGITTYTYDAAGNRLTQTDARGITATYAYDALNRLTSISYPTSSLNVSFAYDQANGTTGCAGSFPTGRLTRITDASGTTTYCYDRRGNTLAKTQVANGITSTLKYTFSKGDRATGIEYPSGAYFAVGYDSTGRAVSLTRETKSSTTPIVTDVDYLPFGPATQLSFAGGATLEFGYDQNYWIDDVAGTALDLDLGTDAIGNIVSLTAGTPAASRSYDYDALSRLTDVDDGNAALIEAFSYDATGNRLSKQTGAGTQSYTYPGTSHRLTGIDATTRSYDAMGSLTDRGDGWTFEYDARQRLTTVREEGVARQINAYNGKGERVRKVEPSFLGNTTHTYAYDDAGRLVAEYRQDGFTVPALMREYLWLDDRLVAVNVLQGAYAGQLLHVHTDHLGTPRAITRPAASNAVVWRWELNGTAFGEHAPLQDPDGDGTAFVFNLRYPGQYFDSESGLHYNYFRDYEPQTGRYVESDPIGLDGGATTYSYGNVSPLSAYDPKGLSAQDLSDAKCCEAVRSMLSKDAEGTVACCNGRKILCTWPSISTGAPPGSLIANCRREHEESHLDDASCPEGCPVLLKVPDRPKHECTAYSDEIACLRRGKHRCGNNSYCQQQVEAEIDARDELRKAWCNKASGS